MTRLFLKPAPNSYSFKLLNGRSHQFQSGRLPRFGSFLTTNIGRRPADNYCLIYDPGMLTGFKKGDSEMPSKIEIPQYAIVELRNSLLGDDVDRRDVLELSIEARNEGLNVRDFTAFLRMADRIYAVCYSDGPRAYARRFRQQLKIDSIHASLLDIKFVEEIGNIAKSHPVITIWIAGNALHKGSEFFKNFTEGLLNLKHLLFEGAPTEAPKLATATGGNTNLPNVPQARDISDQKLAETSDDALTQVARFIDEALKNENLNQAGRFVREVMVDLRLRIRRKQS